MKLPRLALIALAAVLVAVAVVGSGAAGLVPPDWQGHAFVPEPYRQAVSTPVVDGATPAGLYGNGAVPFPASLPAPTDPGHPAAIDVLNQQSYPTVGDFWTIRFDAQGAGDLRISGTDGTVLGGPQPDVELVEVHDGTDTVNGGTVTDDGAVVFAGWGCC